MNQTVKIPVALDSFDTKKKGTKFTVWSLFKADADAAKRVLMQTLTGRVTHACYLVFEPIEK